MRGKKGKKQIQAETPKQINKKTKALNLATPRPSARRAKRNLNLQPKKPPHD
jgi:hypothetical protein